MDGRVAATAERIFVLRRPALTLDGRITAATERIFVLGRTTLTLNGRSASRMSATLLRPTLALD